MTVQLASPEEKCQQVLEVPYDEMVAAHLRCTYAVSNHDFVEAYKCQTLVVQYPFGISGDYFAYIFSSLPIPAWQIYTYTQDLCYRLVHFQTVLSWFLCGSSLTFYIILEGLPISQRGELVRISMQKNTFLINLTLVFLYSTYTRLWDDCSMCCLGPCQWCSLLRWTCGYLPTM